MDSARRWPAWKIAYFGLMFVLGSLALLLIAFLVTAWMSHTSLTGL